MFIQSTKKSDGWWSKVTFTLLNSSVPDERKPDQWFGPFETERDALLCGVDEGLEAK